MTSRGSDAFTYDYENRLTQATVGGVATQYVYNGDGARVKKVVGSAATYYVGNWYEVTNGTVTKYYYFGSQRVAMRNVGAIIRQNKTSPGQGLAAGKHSHLILSKNLCAVRLLLRFICPGWRTIII